MTPRREWIQRFADPAILSDLRDAVIAMAAEVDDCDPETCAHDAALVHPLDVHDWIEGKVFREAEKPPRLVPAGRPGAHAAADQRERTRQLNLALAG